MPQKSKTKRVILPPKRRSTSFTRAELLKAIREVAATRLLQARGQRQWFEVITPRACSSTALSTPNTNLFEAIVFALFDCGREPSCALEIDDASEVRIDKVFSIIADCKFGIHDISRTEATQPSGLPRFNMPLELGMFLAAKRQAPANKSKRCA